MPEHDLMERIGALVQEYGTTWKTLAEKLFAEGFTQDDGTPLTAEAIRKRYNRWMRQETGHSAEAMVPISELLELFKGTIERRDAMLAQKLKAEDEKEYAKDKIESVEARLEERLARRLKEELIELVEDRVDQELKNMVSSGGSFERDLKPLVLKLIEETATGQLVSLFSGIDVSHEHTGGPGRGHKGNRTARFSATMDGETYSRMKRLTGTFSSHLTAACKLYLRALESKREHTYQDSK